MLKHIKKFIKFWNLISQNKKLVILLSWDFSTSYKVYFKFMSCKNKFNLLKFFFHLKRKCHRNEDTSYRFLWNNIFFFSTFYSMLPGEEALHQIELQSCIHYHLPCSNLLYYYMSYLPIFWSNNKMLIAYVLPCLTHIASNSSKMDWEYIFSFMNFMWVVSVQCFKIFWMYAD